MAAAALTYDLRSGQLSLAASDRTIRVPTYHEPARITSWEKVQEQRSGRHTLWDHYFEIPRGETVIPDGVWVGQVPQNFDRPGLQTGRV